MNAANESWQAFDAEYSKTYLHDADLLLPNLLGSVIFNTIENPRIVDIGCGNCRLYNVLKQFNKPFMYNGFDISTPLITAAKSSYSGNNDFQVEQITNDLSEVPLDRRYDFSVAIHVAEICPSIERLFYVLSKSAENSAVIWYEFPRFEFTEIEIRKYVNHDFSKKEIIMPYLRNRFSKDFYESLLKRFSLEVVYSTSISEKDRLDIYRRKK